MGDIAVNQSSLDRKCWNVQRQKKSFWILMSDPRRFTAGTIFYEAWMAPSNHYLHLQVNLFLKSSFLHQLNHNMTRDCSLIYDFLPIKIQVQNMLCTEIVFVIQNNFCTQHVHGECSAKRRASDKGLPVLSNKDVGPRKEFKINKQRTYRKSH